VKKISIDYEVQLKEAFVDEVYLAWFKCPQCEVEYIFANPPDLFSKFCGNCGVKVEWVNFPGEAIEEEEVLSELELKGKDMCTLTEENAEA